jgi:hypothetical protein
MVFGIGPDADLYARRQKEKGSACFTDWQKLGG